MDFELVAVLILLYLIKKIQISKTSIPQPSPTPPPPPPVTLTLNVPSRFNPCETITLNGTLTKEGMPVSNVPVTIYASALEATEPIVTVKTNDKGEFTVNGSVGSDIHFSTHVETQVTLWAEAVVENVKYSSSRLTSTAYADSCMGPCPGTLLVTLRSLVR